MSNVITEQEEGYAKKISKEFTQWLKLRGESNPRRATLSLWLDINSDIVKSWYPTLDVAKVSDIIWDNVWK